MSIVLSCLIILFANALCAETSGEDLYLRGSYLDAENYFREKDMNNPKDVRWRYNRGCAAFKSDQLDASLSAFNSVTKRTDDPEILFRASYNAGNVLFKKGEFAKAAQFYIQALKIKPDDEDTRYNLSVALAKEKAADQQKENKQCDNPKQGDDNQNQQSQDQQKNQKDKQAKKQDSEKKSEESKDGKKQESDDKNQSQQESQKKEEKQKHDMSQELKAAQEMQEGEKKENEPTDEQKAIKMEQMKAEALLDNIQEDQSIMIKMMQDKKGGPAPSGKYW
jgi:Ca-activated chloride channel family protein